MLKEGGYVMTFCKYLIVGREVGENLTPHLQGYCETMNKESITSLQNKFQNPLMGTGIRMAIFAAAGSAQQNIEYCSKEGNVLCERGAKPKGAGHRSDLDAVIKAIENGESMDKIVRQFPRQYISYHRGLQSMSTYFQKPRNFMTIGYWLYGETGTGKSKWAHENFPDAFWKLPDCKWFDGYSEQETVIIDDFRPVKEMSFQMMLRLVDRYPMQVETKGGRVNFAPKRVIITTPKSISETFRHLDFIQEENIQQMKRRFPHQLEFGIPGTLIPLAIPNFEQPLRASLVDQETEGQPEVEGQIN